MYFVHFFWLLILIGELSGFLEVEAKIYGGDNNNNNNNNVNLSDIVVSVTQGQIQGKVSLSRSGRKYLAFLGIPYGKIRERFQVSEPPDNWQGIRDGQNYRNVCAQVDPKTWEVLGSEDCLYLNVFVPITVAKSTRDLHPVIVFLADENFQTSGPPDSFGPDYFMDEDVVLISVNYRLGALGYLTLGEEEILPGNLALKDQVLALKWIQANVHVFGGDRMHVTLFGSGTGSIAVSLHLLSPMSAGLFFNGISTSGTFSCPNAIILEPGDVAENFGKLLNCSSYNNISLELFNCLKGKNTTEILRAQANVTGWEKGQLVTPFGPTVESPSKERLELFKVTKNPGNIEENFFLPDFPENLLKIPNSKRTPWILGINSMPGYCSNVAVLKENATYLQLLNSNWSTLAPFLFHYSQTSTNSSLISDKIQEYYFYNENIDANSLNQLYLALSDHLYFECVKRSALAYGLSGFPVFLYYFTYQRSNFKQVPVTNGVPYMAELQYFFKLNHNIELQITPKSRSIGFSKAIVRLFTSFAKFGHPKETWPRKDNWLSLSEHQVRKKVPLKWYRIDADLASIREPFYARLHFWSKLPTSNKLQEAQAERWNERRKEIQVALQPMSSSMKLLSSPLFTFSYLFSIIFSSTSPYFPSTGPSFS